MLFSPPVPYVYISVFCLQKRHSEQGLLYQRHCSKRTGLVLKFYGTKQVNFISVINTSGLIPYTHSLWHYFRIRNEIKDWLLLSKQINVQCRWGYILNHIKHSSEIKWQSVRETVNSDLRQAIHIWISPRKIATDRYVSRLLILGLSCLVSVLN